MGILNLEKKVKCFEFYYMQQVAEAGFKPIHLDSKLMLVTTPPSP